MRVTHGAPHNLIADSARCGRQLGAAACAANQALRPGDRLWLDDGPALFQVRRTRAGDAWERSRTEACAAPEPDTAPVSLGMPTIRVGAPSAIRVGAPSGARSGTPRRSVQVDVPLGR